MRKPIRAGAASSRRGLRSTCAEHESQIVEYFCQICHVPVCVHCKMVGSHASGDAAHHQLVPVGEAYDHAVASSAAADPLLEARGRAIRSTLGIIGEKMRAVQVRGVRLCVRVCVRAACACACVRVCACVMFAQRRHPRSRMFSRRPRGR